MMNREETHTHEEASENQEVARPAVDDRTTPLHLSSLESSESSKQEPCSPPIHAGDFEDISRETFCDRSQ